MLYAERRGKKMNGKFLHDMLVNWLYFGGIWTLLFLWWAITVEPVLKGTCIEGLPVYKDHILWISSLYTQSVYMYFCGFWCLKKDVIPYPQTTSAVKEKARPRKCKLLNDFKVWNHCEARRKDIPARLCGNLLCMLEFYTTLLVYLFFLASQWFHIFNAQPYWYIFSSCLTVISYL